MMWSSQRISGLRRGADCLAKWTCFTLYAFHCSGVSPLIISIVSGLICFNDMFHDMFVH